MDREGMWEIGREGELGVKGEVGGEGEEMDGGDERWEKEKEKREKEKGGRRLLNVFPCTYVSSRLPTGSPPFRKSLVGSSSPLCRSRAQRNQRQSSPSLLFLWTYR